jgi:beta-glucanase (GH16 family)
MRTGAEILTAFFLSGALLSGCGGAGTAVSIITTAVTPNATAPTISTSTTNGAQNGAEIVSLASTTAASTIYFTLDGSTPTTTSQPYEAPFLVSSNLTVNAIATAANYNASSVTSQTFSPNIPSGTLVWSDEFANSGSTNAQPNPAIWTYDTGTNCCGNSEWENYCAWNSSVAPCNPSNPNAYLAPGGKLYIVAQQPTPGVFEAGAFTSARMKTEGLFSFQYGRIEASISVPESQGMWPAFWMLGSNITATPWPACGEADIMEHIDGNNTPFGGAGTGAGPGYDWMQSSIHGTGENGGIPFTETGFSAASVHKYGMIWSKGQVQYYIDSPTGTGQPYETFTPTNPGGGTWPFDQGPQFILLNLAVGGQWPGYPSSTSGTVFPSQMVVNYVRIYTN